MIPKKHCELCKIPVNQHHSLLFFQDNVKKRQIQHSFRKYFNLLEVEMFLIKLIPRGVKSNRYNANPRVKCILRTVDMWAYARRIRTRALCCWENLNFPGTQSPLAIPVELGIAEETTRYRVRATNSPPRKIKLVFFFPWSILYRWNWWLFVRKLFSFWMITSGEKFH